MDRFCVFRHIYINYSPCKAFAFLFNKCISMTFTNKHTHLCVFLHFFLLFTISSKQFTKHTVIVICFLSRVLLFLVLHSPLPQSFSCILTHASLLTPVNPLPLLFNIHLFLSIRGSIQHSSPPLFSSLLFSPAVG